jgi:hypothetical protein
MAIAGISHIRTADRMSFVSHPMPTGIAKSKRVSPMLEIKEAIKKIILRLFNIGDTIAHPYIPEPALALSPLALAIALSNVSCVIYILLL